MNWLNYHHLMYFRTIATEGSISKASQKLNVGQPALSAQLKQLESAFGQKLFERRNRSLILTEAGKVTLQYANEINGLGMELMERVHLNEGRLKQHLTIGALDSVPKHLVIDVLESAQIQKECSITALDGTSDELYRQLQSHKMDVVIADHHFTPDTDNSIFSKSLGKFRIGVYGTDKYAKLKKGFPQSLSGQPMVLSTSHSKLRHDIEHFFEANKIPLNVSLSTQDTSIQKILAEDSRGLIFEPEFAVKGQLNEGKLIRIGYLPGVHAEYFLSSTKKLVENELLTYLMKDYKFKRPKSEMFMAGI